MNNNLLQVRRDFLEGELSDVAAQGDPLELLQQWYQEAVSRGFQDANAMSLCTIDGEGYPTSRIVLLRKIDQGRLCFFTNYDSAKGQELAQNPKVGLHFFWPGSERQIRLKGSVQKLSAQASDEYFASRPRDSQIGAWASPQSQIVSSRSEIDDLYAKTSAIYKDVAQIPRPPHWGGYGFKPKQIEFWQGRKSRLHDRLQSTYDASSHRWDWVRLAP